jgi:hypothetical protein
MKCALIGVLTLTFAASCASRATPPPAAPASLDRKAAPAESATAAPQAEGRDVSSQDEKGKDAPPEFEKVDFKNFSYPTTAWKRDIRLKDGSYEHADPGNDGGGGDTFDWEGVDFADVTGDANKDAVVQLHRVSCGGSCDGGSHLFYVYSARRNKPNLYWRIETGSLGYGCGLKSLDIKGRKVTLELFNKCRFKGVSPERVAAGEDGFGKFGATAYTRFRFVSNGKTVALKGREIFPFPRGDVRNYRPEISIGDD